MDNLEKRVQDAIRFFWSTRRSQGKKQGQTTGQRDAGTRTDVTGGKHLDGFVKLVRDLLIESGLSEANVYWKTKTTRIIPGYFRAEKEWDLLCVVHGELLAVIEFKAQVGSFGNNCNNRTEEALGSATDLWAAYREGAFKPSQRPWLGYVFLLEDCPNSQSPVSLKGTHYRPFPEFVGASYAKRYEILLTKLLRERLYDGASLLLTSKASGLKGKFSCPCEELGFRTFAAGLVGHAIAFTKLKKA